MRIDLRRAKRCFRCTKTTIGWRLYGTEVKSWIVVELREHRDVGLIVDQGLQHRLGVADAYRYLHPGKRWLKRASISVTWNGPTAPTRRCPEFKLARVLEQVHGLAFEREDLLCHLEELLAERRERHLCPRR